MIATRPLIKKIGGATAKVFEGREIPKIIMDSYSNKEIEDMKTKKMIVEKPEDYDKIVKERKSKDNENIKKGEAARDEMIKKRKPKPVEKKAEPETEPETESEENMKGKKK